MSLGIVLQEEDRIVIGGDTALSANINGQLKRIGEIKKVFKFGNDAVFLTGISDYVHVVYAYLDSQNDKYIDTKKLQRFLRQLPKSNDLYCGDISILITRVVDSNSYAYLLDCFNNYEIQESVLYGKGFKLLIAGVKAQEAQNIMTVLLKQGLDVVTAYEQCYKKLSCQVIGRDINLLLVDNDGIHDLANIRIDNINCDSTFEESNNKYCLIAPALVGEMVMSKKLQIKNESGTYVINDNGFKMSKGESYIMFDPDKPSIVAHNKKGDDVLDFNSNGEGELVIKGKIEGGSINIGEGFSVDEDGKMQATGAKIEGSFDITGGKVNINTAYDSDDSISFNYKNDNSPLFRNILINRDGFAYKTELVRDGRNRTEDVLMNSNSITFTGEGNKAAGDYKVSIKAGTDGLECDKPLHAEEIHASNMKSGSVTKNITAKDTRFYEDVKLVDMPNTPSVVVTPVTDNPAAVSVSVENVSKSGFRIYMYRTDKVGELQVNWIAMC